MKHQLNGVVYIEYLWLDPPESGASRSFTVVVAAAPGPGVGGARLSDSMFPGRLAPPPPLWADLHLTSEISGHRPGPPSVSRLGQGETNTVGRRAEPARTV